MLNKQISDYGAQLVSAYEEAIIHAHEMHATMEVLMDWAEKHGYVIGGWSDKKHRIMHTDGNVLEGQDVWLTFHEMLAALLEMIDNEAAK